MLPLAYRPAVDGTLPTRLELPNLEDSSTVLRAKELAGDF